MKNTVKKPIKKVVKKVVKDDTNKYKLTKNDKLVISIYEKLFNEKNTLENNDRLNEYLKYYNDDDPYSYKEELDNFIFNLIDDSIVGCFNYGSLNNTCSMYELSFEENPNLLKLNKEEFMHFMVLYKDDKDCKSIIMNVINRSKAYKYLTNTIGLIPTNSYKGNDGTIVSFFYNVK